MRALITLTTPRLQPLTTARRWAPWRPDGGGGVTSESDAATSGNFWIPGGNSGFIRKSGGRRGAGAGGLSAH